MISLEDFHDDQPWIDESPGLSPLQIPGQIDGVILRRLITHEDSRGDLTVLLSQHYVPNAITPHVYLVRAAAGSTRGWVYHKRQSDRLAYTVGAFRVVLYDLRPNSSTYGALNVLELGADNPVQLTIPPFVVHGVQNYGTTDSYFINMPTNAYDPSQPDKSRISLDHPEMPYHF